VFVPTRRADPTRQAPGEESEREVVSAFLGLTLLVRDHVAEYAKLYSGLGMALACVVGFLRVMGSKRPGFQVAQLGASRDFQRFYSPRTWKHARRRRLVSSDRSICVRVICTVKFCVVSSHHLEPGFVTSEVLSPTKMEAR
jgi:hypothetical protein